MQTRCIVKGEAQKSPLFWRFSGGLWFSQDRLFFRNSTRKPLNLINPRFLQTSLVNPLVFTMHVVCTLLIFFRNNLTSRAIYRMGNGPGAKIPEKWEGKWKMAPRLTWPKNGRRNGKNGQNQAKIPFLGPFFRFGGHFLAISGGGPFSIFFPIFPGVLLRARFPFCKWPLQSQLTRQKNNLKK